MLEETDVVVDGGDDNDDAADEEGEGTKGAVVVDKDEDGGDA